jgi:hypothetical protein
MFLPLISFIIRELQYDINIVFECMNEWLKANLLSVNFNKTHFIQFTATSKSTSDINITYNKQIVPITDTKFPGILKILNYFAL